MLRPVLTPNSNNITGAVGGSLAGDALQSLAQPIIEQAVSQVPPESQAALRNALNEVVAAAGGALAGGGSSGAIAGAGSASNNEVYNRQLDQSERQWASTNAVAFAKYYEQQTGLAITPDQAQQLLLGNGLRLVDSAASNVPGANATAIAYISQNANGLFKKDSNYNNPFVNNVTGSPTPEQQVLTYNPYYTGNMNGQIGTNAGFHLFDLGGNGEVGLAVSLGSNPNVCVYAQACATMGLGFNAGAGVAATVGQGAASTGISSSKGA